MLYFVPSFGLITTSQFFIKTVFKIFPIVLALCLMLSETCYAHNYAGIIGLGLIVWLFLYFRKMLIKHLVSEHKYIRKYNYSWCYYSGIAN